MKNKLCLAACVTALTFLITAAVALAAYPWKGRTFDARVHNVLVTLAVAKSGKSAVVRMEREPHFCTNAGGFAPVKAHAHAAPISSRGAFSETILFTDLASPVSPEGKLDGHVTVKGTFSASKFKGTLKTVYASGTFCNGQAVFVARRAA